MSSAAETAMPEDSSSQFLDFQVVTRLMAQPLLSRFPMEGSVSGHHKSPHRGSSVEFAEYRNYVPGDDPRRLDWRVYGRTDRFYMKEFEAETNLRCYLVLDCSASMSFTAAHGSKLAYAKRLVATLAYLTIQQGDAAGLVAVGQKTLRDLPPRRHPVHLRNIFDELDRLNAQGGTGLVAGLHELAERIQRRALILIFSDFFCEPESLRSCLQHLRFQKHDISVFQLLDRAELEFRFDRPMRFVDLETAHSLVTEPGLVRDKYLDHLQNSLAALRTACHQFKAEYHQVVTDQDYERVLADFLVERARNAALAPI
jgi:uncharacterized protein (DUF58 family)